MRPGTHAAADGSFGRSAGAAMGRGVLLLAVALVIGIVLLNATDDQPPGTDVAAGSSSGRSGDGNANDDDATAATTTTAPPTTLPAARNPAEVKVLVANGSTVKGAAGGARNKLIEAKFNVLSPIDAPTKGNESAVYFTAEYQADANAVAAALGIPVQLVKAMPTPPPVPDLKTSNVLVVLGTDHAGRFGAAPAAGAATTTTAAPAAGGGTSSTTSTTKKP
ncbi:MAG TPA: LytR C-terminal domain-containing protein [Acidimicrobiales bacterium]|nr:LytR C-terminal domain-containing protein [Acidimicrobiales bacterium]